MRKFRVVGPHRADIQWGLLTAHVANQWGGKVRVAEVMPYHDPLEEDITADELARKLLVAIG